PPAPPPGDWGFDESSGCADPGTRRPRAGCSGADGVNRERPTPPRGARSSPRRGSSASVAVRLELDLLRGEAVRILLGRAAARDAGPEDPDLRGLAQAGGPIRVARAGPERAVAHDAGHDLLCDMVGAVEDLGLGRHSTTGRLSPLKDRMAVAEHGRSAARDLEREVAECRVRGSEPGAVGA